MTADEGAGEDGDGDLPASMADLFFALVAIVIFMLLALAPAVMAPRSTTPDPPAAKDIWQADLRIDGRKPLILVAQEGGLRSVGLQERIVPLDAILDDADLAARLRDAKRTGTDILLGIEPEGLEASFLFDALAGTLDLGDISQLRVGADCGQFAAVDLLRACRRNARGGPLP